MWPSPCMLALPLLPHVGLEECFPSFTWGSMSQQSPQIGSMLATQQISGCDMRARLHTPLWNGLGPSPGVRVLAISTSMSGRRRPGGGARARLRWNYQDVAGGMVRDLSSHAKDGSWTCRMAAVCAGVTLGHHARRHVIGSRTALTVSSTLLCAIVDVVQQEPVNAAARPPFNE